MKTAEDFKQVEIPVEVPKNFAKLFSDLCKYTQNLESKIRLFEKEKFGSKSEAFNPDQGSLFNEIEEVNTDGQDDEPSDTEVQPHKRKKRRKQIELSADLERQEPIIHKLSSEERACPCCGEEMCEIGEDKREKLDVVPAKLSVKVDIYKKYACKNKDCDDPKPKQATVSTAIPKIKATDSTLAYIATQKYLYGMPLYRLEFFFAFLGVLVSRYVMSKWMIMLAGVLKPIYLCLEEKLLEDDYVHIDETRLQVLREEGRKATTKSWAWVRTTGGPNAPPIVLYHYSPNRSAKTAQDLLRGFRGFVHSDDYEGYASAFDANDHIQRLLCWDHTRRYFYKAYMGIPERNRKGSISEQALKLIKKLYKIESRIKDESDETRLSVRQEEALITIEKIKLLCEKNQSRLTKDSPTAKAINYTLDNIELLKVYTTDSRLNISNAPAEQAIRPFVIGRKAWLFSNTPAGAEASMILYSIMITAKQNGLDPFKYLVATLKKLPHIKTADDLEELLPLKQGG